MKVKTQANWHNMWANVKIPEGLEIELLGKDGDALGEELILRGLVQEIKPPEPAIETMADEPNAAEDEPKAKKSKKTKEE